jgi:hypothetical protein
MAFLQDLETDGAVIAAIVAAMTDSNSRPEYLQEVEEWLDAIPESTDQDLEEIASAALLSPEESNIWEEFGLSDPPLLERLHIDPTTFDKEEEDKAILRSEKMEDLVDEWESSRTYYD